MCAGISASIYSHAHVCIQFIQWNFNHNLSSWLDLIHWIKENCLLRHVNELQTCKWVYLDLVFTRISFNIRNRQGISWMLCWNININIHWNLLWQYVKGNDISSYKHQSQENLLTSYIVDMTLYHILISIDIITLHSILWMCSDHHSLILWYIETLVAVIQLPHKFNVMIKNMILPIVICHG